MSSSLYIHIPFCRSKCSYCSFVSFEGKDSLIEPYLEALRKEAHKYKGSCISTVYIGGGTPTCLSESQFRILFDIIHSNFIIAQDAEITIEANPATFDLAKARAVFLCGSNRISLGVQSLNDNYLKYLGRPHNALDARMAFNTLREAGFKNINLDLMYSLPSESKQETEEDVTELISLGSEHLSLYALSVGAGSEFHDLKIEPPKAEIQGEHHLYISQFLKRNGFLHYEISNFGKTGYFCRHNLNYWRGGNYIGLGTAAHSHIDGHRWWNCETIDGYIALIKDKASAIAGDERLSEEKRFMETLLIGLRLTQGVDVADLEERFEVSLPEEKRDIISGLIEHGLLADEKGRLKATMTGMVVLDDICSRLI